MTWRIESPLKSSRKSIGCPNCDGKLLLRADAKIIQADRVVIDRHDLKRRAPKRWDVVALEDPEESTRLIVKRIVGLPGETVEVVDGLLSTRSPGAGIEERQVIDSMTVVSDDRYRCDNESRWQNVDGSEWKKTKNGHSIDVRDQLTIVHWLTYTHENHFPGTQRGVIYDDNIFNLSVGRQLQVAANVSVTGLVRVTGRGSLFLRCECDHQTWTCEYDVSDRSWSIAEREARRRHRLTETDLPFEISVQSSFVRFRTSNVVASQALESFAAGEAKFLIGATNLKVELADLMVSRSPRVTMDSPRPATAARWVLASDEYFLLGDNSPVSVDSRHWSRMIRRSELLGTVRHH